MPALSLDTHRLVKELTATGFTEEQAEAVTRAVLVGRELDLSHLATEAGVAEQIRGLDRKIDAVRADLEHRIDQLDRKIDGVRADMEVLKRDLTIRLGAMIAAAAVLVTVLDRLL